MKLNTTRQQCTHRRVALILMRRDAATCTMHNAGVDLFAAFSASWCSSGHLEDRKGHCQTFCRSACCQHEHQHHHSCQRHSQRPRTTAGPSMSSLRAQPWPPRRKTVPDPTDCEDTSRWSQAMPGSTVARPREPGRSGTASADPPGSPLPPKGRVARPSHQCPGVSHCLADPLTISVILGCWPRPLTGLCRPDVVIRPLLVHSLQLACHNST